MEHVAIDLGGRESQICIRSEDGQIVEERRCATNRLKAFLTRRPPSRVVLESCAEAFRVADHAREAGHEVVVVPATLAPALGVGARGVKNDVRDARNLSVASCRMAELPKVHVASALSRTIKTLCSLREGHVGARTVLVNAVRGYLRGLALGPMAGGTVRTFASRVRRFAAAHEVELPSHVARTLATIDLLCEQVEAADEELAALLEDNEVCQRLMTVPGVGPVTAARYFAAIDDVSRFDSAARVQSYLGLTPGEDSSSERKRITSITKAGATRVRWTLVQAAWSALRTKGRHAMLDWARRIGDRRGKFVAAVALARKIAGILYAIWRDRTVYDPMRGAAST